MTGLINGIILGLKNREVTSYNFLLANEKTVLIIIEWVFKNCSYILQDLCAVKWLAWTLVPFKERIFFPLNFIVNLESSLFSVSFPPKGKVNFQSMIMFFGDYVRPCVYFATGYHKICYFIFLPSYSIGSNPKCEIVTKPQILIVLTDIVRNINHHVVIYVSRNL